MTASKFDSPALGQDNPICSAMGEFDSFRLVAETQRQALAITESARDAVRTFYRCADELAVFIERRQTPVYLLKNGFMAGLFLMLLGYDPGYIPPSRNRRYRLLTAFLEAFSPHPGCTPDYGVFVLTRPLFTVGFLSHQLHHWLACRSGMGGYNDRAQRLYRRFWSRQQGMIGSEVYQMSLDDMTDLRAAIHRDLEALAFLKNVASEILIPARQGQAFRSGQTDTASA